MSSEEIDLNSSKMDDFTKINDIARSLDVSPVALKMFCEKHGIKVMKMGMCNYINKSYANDFGKSGKYIVHKVLIEEAIRKTEESKADTKNS
jgi:hypothetical protein